MIHSTIFIELLQHAWYSVGGWDTGVTGWGELCLCANKCIYIYMHTYVLLSFLVI